MIPKSFFHFGLLLLICKSILLSQTGWQVINTQFGYGSIFFPSRDTGYSVGLGFIAKTTNGGYNWFSLNADNHDYHDLFFFNNNRACVTGTNIAATTTDGGITFLYNVPSGNPGLSKVFFIDMNTGWAVGGFSLYKTQNGGNSWVSFGLAPPYQNAVMFVSPSVGWCVGGTAFQKTLNGGQSWTQQSVPNEDYTDIFFINSNVGCAVGGYSYETEVIVMTTNGGNNWVSRSSGNADPLRKCSFINSLTGYACGKNGKIIRTTNSGTSWSVQPGGTTMFLSSISFVNDSIGYISGSYLGAGVLLKTTNGGVTAINTISEQIPGSFSLSQNYPNPFNPTTNIKFEIPNSGFVKLIVYDITGREVETLVNENLNAGTYNFDWNAASFSSGVYLYKIQTEKFTEIKKMILVK